MTAFNQTVEIMAGPEAIFDLICKVEEFSQYSKLIESVRKTGEKSFHWKAKIAGIPLEWDSVIIEERRPQRFAWHSVKGFKNSGSYTLSPSPAGTRVSFEMEYNLKTALLEKPLSPLFKRYMNELSENILTEIKKRLEKEEG